MNQTKSTALYQTPFSKAYWRDAALELKDTKILVFAATGDADENRRIAALCRSLGVLCNCASTPEEGNFQVPAVARCAPLAAALSTGGASPALARRWKGELAQWLAPRARMATLMGRLRPLVLALGVETGQNTQLFRSLAVSPLQQWLEAGDIESCRQCLLAELPVRRVLSALTVLEIDGYVCRQGARSFLRTVELKKE